jgi:hypothetical protein
VFAILQPVQARANVITKVGLTQDCRRAFGNISPSRLGSERLGSFPKCEGCIQRFSASRLQYDAKIDGERKNLQELARRNFLKCLHKKGSAFRQIGELLVAAKDGALRQWECQSSFVVTSTLTSLPRG